MSLDTPSDKMGMEEAQSCYLHVAKEAEDFYASLAWLVRN